MDFFNLFADLAGMAELTALCDCACHVMGIYGGTTCPAGCPRSARFDGCHRCGCPGTTCPIGECNTRHRALPSPHRETGEPKP